MTDKEVFQRCKDAQTALGNVLIAHQNRKCALIEQVNATLEAEFGAAIRAAQTLANDAMFARDNAMECAAIEQARPPYPVGTKLTLWEKWEKYNPTLPATSPVWLKTKISGQVEIVTSKTVYPANTRWSTYSLGTVIIRLLKSDGSESKNSVGPSIYTKYAWSYWRPVGIDLNEELYGAERAAERKKQEKLTSAAKDVFGL